MLGNQSVCNCHDPDNYTAAWTRDCSRADQARQDTLWGDSQVLLTQLSRIKKERERIKLCICSFYNQLNGGEHCDQDKEGIWIVVQGGQKYRQAVSVTGMWQNWNHESHKISSQQATSLGTPHLGTKQQRSLRGSQQQSKGKIWLSWRPKSKWWTMHRGVNCVKCEEVK